MPENSIKVKPKLMLFDIGGVIIDLDFRDARATLESEYLMDPETFSELTRSGFSGNAFSVTEKAMIGAISTEDYLLAFQNGCKRPVPMETVEKLRVSMLGPERPAMLAFLTELKEKFRVAAFTNTIDLHWRLLINPDHYRFPQLFETVFASHLIGEAKPTKQSFSKVLDALGVSPEEVVFVDDSALNVSGAAQLGINGIVFKDLGTLRVELKKYVEV